MKQTLKVSVMALVAMFAFSTVADAQFGLGKLVNKARKSVGLKTKQEKRQDSIQTAIQSITPTIPQPAAEGSAPIAIRWGSTQIGVWDPVALEIIFNKTYDEGEFAGQKVTYKLNPATGKWTSKKGTEVGSINNDGTIESPNLGTLKFNPETYKVIRNDEVIGEATKLKASCFGTTIGSFDGHVSPLLVAYTFHGILISPNQVTAWKEAKIKRDLEAAARAAQARSQASSSQSSSSGKTMDLYLNGSRFGEIRPNGDVFYKGSRRGEFRSNGDIYVNGSRKGEIRSNGDVYKNGSRVGEIRSNNDIYINGSRVGEIRSNGDIFKNGSRIGNVTNMSDVRKVAIIYFFEFF